MRGLYFCGRLEKHSTSRGRSWRSDTATKRLRWPRVNSWHAWVLSRPGDGKAQGQKFGDILPYVYKRIFCIGISYMYINIHFLVDGFKYFIFHTSDYKIKLSTTERTIVQGPHVYFYHCLHVSFKKYSAYLLVRLFSYKASMASEEKNICLVVAWKPKNTLTFNGDLSPHDCLWRTYEGWNVTYTDIHYLQPYTPFSSSQTKDFLSMPNRRHFLVKLVRRLANAVALNLNNIKLR